jgi:hypothetical protein
MMNVLVFSGAEVAAKEERLDARVFGGVGGVHVCKLAVLRASLAHDDLSVVFYDLCFDFTGMLVHQRLERSRTGDHGIADFFYASGTKTVCLARKA